MNKTKKLSKAENDNDENSRLKKTNSNKILKYKKNIKPQRLKFNLSNVGKKDDMNNLNKSSTNVINNKKTYIKKLVHLNNKEIYNPKNNSIKSSTATNFYTSKMNNSLSTTNIQLNTSTIEDKKNDNNDNEINSYSYIKSFNKKLQYKRESLNQRLNKKLKGKIVNDKNNNISNNYGKDNINDKKSVTSDNFYAKTKSKTTTSEKNLNASDMKNININEEIKTKRLSYYLGKKNKDLNNSLKEVNKALTMNFIEENNKNKCITERSYNTKENLSNKGGLKKLEANKIKIKTKITSGNLNKSKIAEKTKKIDKKNSFYNNSANSGSLVTIKEYKNKDKEKDKDKDKIKDKNATQDNIQTSIYKIIKKTKDFFTNNNKEDDEDKDKDKEKSKKMTNQNFYKSQTNFYKKKIENKNESASDNEFNFNRKNSSTIIINNNININISDKTTKIKIPQLNIKNAVLISKNNYSLNSNNKYDTQRVDKNKNKTLNVNNNTNTAKKTLNIFNKFSFNKKDLDKQKK